MQPAEFRSSLLSRRQLLSALPALGLGRHLVTVQRATTAEVIVLGTSQDAGVPQFNCFKGYCARVRAGEREPPRGACLGLWDAGSEQRFMIDATLDFPAQFAALLAATGGGSGVAGTVARVTDHLHGILITHTHMGHYTGLMHLGREGASTYRMPVYASSSTCNYLRNNGPWSQLVALDQIRLIPLEPGRRFVLSANLTITPLAVPHRSEYSDTLGYLIAGPSRTLMAIPDTDTWDDWPVRFEDCLALSDVALLDGSFWSYDELGHRVQGDVPHPPMAVTIDRLVGHTTTEIWFYHMNHTNPLWEETAPQRALLPEGFGIASQGMRVLL